MKRIMLILLLFPVAAIASQYNITGKVYMLRDNSLVDDADFLLIQGGDSAGACKRTDGLVVVRIPDTNAADRAFAIALAAQASDKRVRVNVDDTVLGVGDYCLLRYINILSSE